MFDNLTALTTLDLDDNGLTALPAGVFDNLTALTTLLLDSNGLTALRERPGSALPAGVFDNLTTLAALWLDNNGLTALRDGVFDNLTALRTLDLDNTGLTALRDGVFDNLTALRELVLTGNPGAPFAPTAMAEAASATVASAGGPGDTGRLGATIGQSMGRQCLLCLGADRPVEWGGGHFRRRRRRHVDGHHPGAAGGNGAHLHPHGDRAREDSPGDPPSPTSKPPPRSSRRWPPYPALPGASRQQPAGPPGSTSTWSAPASDGGSPITGYRIEVSLDGGSNWTDRVANTNGDEPELLTTFFAPTKNEALVRAKIITHVLDVTSV